MLTALCGLCSLHLAGSLAGRAGDDGPLGFLTVCVIWSDIAVVSDLGDWLLQLYQVSNAQKYIIQTWQIA